MESGALIRRPYRITVHEYRINESTEKPMRPQPCRLIAALLVAAWVSTAPAQAPPLTLEDCVRLALEAPSAATVAEREEAIAGERRTAARSELLPQFGLSGGYNYNSPLSNGANPFSFVAANGVREYLATADMSWSLDLSGRLRAGLSLARSLRDVAGANAAIARRDIRRAVGVAFYDVLVSRRVAGLEEQSLEEAREFERLTGARYRQGEASRADVLKASAQRAQFEQRLSQARLDARLANQILASFWTADVDSELPLADTLDAPPAPSVEALEGDLQQARSALESRPEMARLTALGRSAEAQQHIARAGLKPQADLVLQYGLDANQLRADQRGYAAYVSLRVPVFDWFRSRSGVREARYRREQVDFQRASAERALTREYLAARSRVESWHERIPMARGERDAARENLRLVRLLYEGGEGPAADVVLAQTQAAQAGRAYYSAAAQYQRALADFELAAGR